MSIRYGRKDSECHALVANLAVVAVVIVNHKGTVIFKPFGFLSRVFLSG